MSPKTRRETDTFGPIEVEDHRLWGAQTQGSLQNFRIGTERMPLPLVHALALVEQASALVNRDLGSNPVGRMRSPKRRPMSWPGGTTTNFRWRVWQTGWARSNMNMNSVRQPRQRAPGGRRGEKVPVHPNDHVNKGQSSNDSFPTAMHIAAAREIDVGVAAGPAPSPSRPRRQSEGVCRHRKDRAHAPSGRHSGDPRPGILRLRDAGPARDRGSRRRCPASMPWPRAGPPWHRPLHVSGLRRALRRRRWS